MDKVTNSNSSMELTPTVSTRGMIKLSISTERKDNFEIRGKLPHPPSETTSGSINEDPEFLIPVDPPANIVHPESDDESICSINSQNSIQDGDSKHKHKKIKQKQQFEFEDEDIFELENIISSNDKQYPLNFLQFNVGIRRLVKV